MIDKQDLYLRRIRESYPALRIETVRWLADGQFNDIYIVNDEVIFRFPKSPHAAETLAKEVAILRKIRNFVTLAIPDPVYVGENGGSDQSFMGYPMILGEPLWKKTLDSINDGVVLDRLAMQIATFLKELHGIPADSLGSSVVSDGRTEWQEMYTGFRDQLYPHMRPDAREWVTKNFEAFLSEPAHFTYTPAFRHGDFGGSNILYDAETQQITGVIDFAFAGLGDPALDAAAISTIGEDFFHRICTFYPELGTPQVQQRAQFYKSTYALQEALYGLRDGDQESFESGIAQYR